MTLVSPHRVQIPLSRLYFHASRTLIEKFQNERVEDVKSEDISGAFRSVASHLGECAAPSTIRSHRRKPRFSEKIIEKSAPSILKESKDNYPKRLQGTSEEGPNEESLNIVDKMLMERLESLEKDVSEEPFGISSSPSSSEFIEGDLEKDVESIAENRAVTQRKVSLVRCLRRAGMVSLTHGNELIHRGEVYVNNEKVCDPFRTIEPEDVIFINGSSGPLRFQGSKLWAFYKPRNMSCVAVSKNDQPNIWRKLAACFGHSHLIPIRPLHFEDRGLMLLTNDGELAHYMSDPTVGLQRTYVAKVTPKIDSLLADKLTSNGIYVDGSIYRNISIYVAHHSTSSNANYIRLCIRGKMPYKIVDLMGKLGRRASKITRLSMGPYSSRGMNPMKINEITVLPNYLKQVNPTWAGFIDRDRQYFRHRRLKYLRHLAQYRPLSPKEANELDACSMDGIIDLITDSSWSEGSESTDLVHAVSKKDEEDHPRSLMDDIVNDEDLTRAYIHTKPLKREVTMQPPQSEVVRF